jgi:nitrate reductase NapE component
VDCGAGNHTLRNAASATMIPALLGSSVLAYLAFVGLGMPPLLAVVLIGAYGLVAMAMAYS